MALRLVILILSVVVSASYTLVAPVTAHAKSSAYMGRVPTLIRLVLNDTDEEVSRRLGGEGEASGGGPSMAEVAGGAVALKIASGVITKVVATTVTVTVAAPALKLATVGAGLVQMGYGTLVRTRTQLNTHALIDRMCTTRAADRYQERKQERAIDQRRRNLEQRQAEASALAEEEERLASVLDRSRALGNAADGALRWLPSAGSISVVKVVFGGVLGATIGSALSARGGRRMAITVATVVLLTRALQTLSRKMSAALELQTTEYAAVAQSAAFARDAASAAAASVTAAEDGTDITITPRKGESGTESG